MADEARSRLGRGLASLIGDVGGEAAHLDRPRTQRKVPIEFLRPNPRNPRRAFPDTELGELADSIRQHGVIQPIVVRPVKGAQDRYEIIAGERRWRASQIAGLHEVPIVPVDVSDADALEFAIIENVQREDLNAMEEAQGYHALADEFKRSQEDIAKIVGKSRSHVANMMRLTKLPAEVQAYIAAGQLSAGHARALIGVPDPLAAAKTHRRGGPQCPAGRGAGACRGRAGAQAAEGARRQDQGHRHGSAGEAGQRRAGAQGCRQSSRSRRHRADQLPQPRTARRSHAQVGAGLLSLSSRIRRDREYRALRDGSGDRGLFAHVERCGPKLIDDRDKPRGVEIDAMRFRPSPFREKCSRGNPLSRTVDSGVPSATASADLCSQAA